MLSIRFSALSLSHAYSKSVALSKSTKNTIAVTCFEHITISGDTFSLLKCENGLNSEFKRLELAHYFLMFSMTILHSQSSPCS